MTDVIFMIGLTRNNDLPVGVRIIRRDESKLGRSFTERAQQDDGLVPRTRRTKVKELVFLFIDEMILVIAQHVPPELIAAFRHRIFGHVEDRFVIDRPGDTAYTLN